MSSSGNESEIWQGIILVGGQDFNHQEETGNDQSHQEARPKVHESDAISLSNKNGGRNWAKARKSSLGMKDGKDPSVSPGL